MLRSPARSLRTSAARPPRSPRAWAVAGCLLGALPVLLLFAPASWLAAGVERASGGQVLFAQPRGTVWTGSAQLVLTGGQGSADRAALPGRLHWRLRPAWGGLHAQLAADCCTSAPIAARVALRWGGVHVAVADGLSQWPAAVLSGLGTPFNTLQPQGRLALRTQGLALDSAAGRVVVSGQAQLDALGMSSRLSTLRPMGSYRFTLQGGEVTTLSLATLDGALRLTGSGRWIGQRLRFEGEATAAPEREGALSNLLNIIGRRTGARSLITVG